MIDIMIESHLQVILFLLSGSTRSSFFSSMKFKPAKVFESSIPNIRYCPNLLLIADIASEESLFVGVTSNPSSFRKNTVKTKANAAVINDFS